MQYCGILFQYLTFVLFHGYSRQTVPDWRDVEKCKLAKTIEYQKYDEPMIFYEYNHEKELRIKPALFTVLPPVSICKWVDQDQYTIFNELKDDLNLTFDPLQVKITVMYGSYMEFYINRYSYVKVDFHMAFMARDFCTETRTLYITTWPPTTYGPGMFSYYVETFQVEKISRYSIYNGHEPSIEAVANPATISIQNSLFGGALFVVEENSVPKLIFNGGAFAIESTTTSRIIILRLDLLDQNTYFILIFRADGTDENARFFKFVHENGHGSIRLHAPAAVRDYAISIANIRF